jgi:hypothetical protein
MQEEMTSTSIRLDNSFLAIGGFAVYIYLMIVLHINPKVILDEYDSIA